jgi:CelD/BcsL family acetyltransferase involved in cellulose biosynthesis
VEAPHLHTSLIKDWSGVRALAPEWNALLAQSRADTLFLTWEWIEAWIDVTQERHRPFVIVVRDEQDRLCGIAPFYVSAYRLVGVLPFRMLRVLADDATGSEYPDWIIDRHCAPAVEAQIAVTLNELPKHWDGVWLPNLSGWTGAERDLSGVLGNHGCRSQRRSVAFCSIALPDSLARYEGGLSKVQREQTRRKCRKILNQADVHITRCEAPEEIGTYLEALFDLHHRRWQLRGDPGSFERRPELQLFYRRFLPVALRKGWLRLYALREAEAFRALQLGYVYNNVFYQIQEGFDPDFTSGAGNVLRHKVIEACIAEGVGTYDLLAGASEHKRRWGAATREGHDLFVGRPGALTRLLVAAGIWPTGRYLRPAGGSVARERLEPRPAAHSFEPQTPASPR